MTQMEACLHILQSAQEDNRTEALYNNIADAVIKSSAKTPTEDVYLMALIALYTLIKIGKLYLHKKTIEVLYSNIADAANATDAVINNSTKRPTEDVYLMATIALYTLITIGKLYLL
ncbi:hypothetical protein OWV82_018218 [Melia azedarach]|uniref:Uncharacterized protein n=1 Tax=Melia azedarach TaxID=155640 RepID=A0ACC1XAS2_MELAZ|nr:hypothetical protein OWV82_018218 [Melia azedarach]